VILHNPTYIIDRYFRITYSRLVNPYYHWH